jgi:predicted transcriptional regulator
MESEIMSAIDKVADKVIELQDKVASYIRSGSSVPKSLLDELQSACQELDDLQEELDQCVC